MVNGGEVRIDVLLVALASRMTFWAVGGIQSHPFVSFSASLCVATTGHSASKFYNLVAASFKAPVRPVWYCGAVLASVEMLFLVHRQIHTRARFSAQRYNGAAMNRGNLTATV